MNLELNKQGDKTPHDIPAREDFSHAEAEIIYHISHLYTGLEYIATHDSTNLSKAGKANIRRAQGQLQLLRLKLIDYINSKYSQLIGTDMRGNISTQPGKHLFIYLPLL